MHVSILAGLLLVSSAYSEHDTRVAAPFHHLVRVGVDGAHLRSGAYPTLPWARRNAQLVSGASFLHGIFSREWD